MCTEAIEKNVYERESTLESKYLAETNQPSHLLTRVEEHHLCWPKMAAFNFVIKAEEKNRLHAPERVRMFMEREIEHIVERQLIPLHGKDVANMIMKFKG